jgi:hypothetical protein
MEFLNGYKSFMVALAIIAVGVLNALGYVSEDIRDTVVTILLGTGVATLRHGISKAEM